MTRTRYGDDRGAIVAEFAVALPAIVVVVLLAVGALSVTGQHIRLQDAASDAARLAARGEPDGRVAAAVEAAVADATTAVTGD
ncbi:TadE family type IV pilus minor pilin, partial [Microbacterium koreense]